MYPLICANLALHWVNRRNKRRNKQDENIRAIQTNNHARDCEMFKMMRRHDTVQALPAFDPWDDNMSSFPVKYTIAKQSAAASGDLGAEAYFLDLLGDEDYEMAFGGRDW